MSEQSKTEGMAAMRQIFGGNPEKLAAQEAAWAAEREVEVGKLRGDALALLFLAEQECPADVKQFGENHKIPTFAEHTWMAGFRKGWRLAVAMMETSEKGGEEGR